MPRSTPPIPQRPVGKNMNATLTLGVKGDEITVKGVQVRRAARAARAAHHPAPPRPARNARARPRGTLPPACHPCTPAPLPCLLRCPPSPPPRPQNSAKVLRKDLRGGNVVIHVIDSVLLGPGVRFGRAGRPAGPCR
jgi:hypothetical protein